MENERKNLFRIMIFIGLTAINISTLVSRTVSVVNLPDLS